MKKYIILLMLIIISFCFAEIDVKLDISPSTTLKEISFQTHIPVKKLAHLLDDYIKSGIEINNDTTFKETELTLAQLENAVTEFEEVKQGYYWIIVFIGMGIVFLSLIVTGFVIGLLQHLNIVEKLKEKKIAKNSKPKIKKITTTDGNLSSDSIVAVITAIYLHELEVEEKNKMNITWKRASLSMWQAANKVNLPNRAFFNSRRKV